jgi:hypothetical protein
MGWIHRGIEGNTLVLNKIMHKKFLTESNKTPKGSTPVPRKGIKDDCTSQFQTPITHG